VVDVGGVFTNPEGTMELTYAWSLGLAFNIRAKAYVVP